MAKKSTSSKKKKKKGFFKKLLSFLFIGLFLLSVAGLAYWFWPMPDRDIYDFVPEDACYVIEADDPIENWKAFSKTKIWKALKKNELFEDIEANANYLDTLIMDNERIFKLVSGKKLLIVSQMYIADDYDFLYLMDLKKGAKVSFFMDIFKGIMNTAGMSMKKKDMAGHTIYGIGEGKDEVLLGFVDNVLVCSYSKTLLLKSLTQHEKPHYSHLGAFQTMRKKAYKLGNKESLAKLHVNFDQIDEMMGVYMDEVSPSMTNLSQIMQYASFDIKMQDRYAEL
ncbi:MAG TPA: hypothetical protein ENJ82_12645, partial [Bacteroidetes bacterium]|nr:hypothetical protein [Bacteroidota bacterium]